MPDLNADISLFNLNNRGDNGSLQTARNTLNQVLTDMNWTPASTDLPNVPLMSASIRTLSHDKGIVEAFNDNQNRLFYTTDQNYDSEPYYPRFLWMTDGETVTDLAAYLPNNDRTQQVFDIIGKRSDNYLYFTRAGVDLTKAAFDPYRLELWKTDGSQTGTQLVKTWSDVAVQSNVMSMKDTNFQYIINDRIYITLPLGRSLSQGFAIWESQGTEATTQELSAIRTLTQQAPAGLGKFNPNEPSLALNYSPDQFKPIAKIQASDNNVLYFTLEVSRPADRQPNQPYYSQSAHTYYEMWALDRQTNGQLSKISEFNYVDALRPANFIRFHLPIGLNTDRQGAYGSQASNTTNVFNSLKYESYYIPFNESAVVRGNDGERIVAFQDGGNTLTQLGYVDVPFQSYGQAPSTTTPESERAYFVRNIGNQREIWLTNADTNGAQKIATFDNGQSGTSQVYKLGRDRLIVITYEGLKSLKITAKPDPTIALTNGNYRVLKDLAWEIGGAALAQEVVLPEIDTTGWSIKGIRDYDGDGDVDIFWRNQVSGQGVFWQMNGLRFEKGLIIGPQANYSNWEVRGFGDFDQDGDQDIFWQNSSGVNVIWEMQGLNFKSGTLLFTTPTNDWSFGGIGNFNADRNLEVLWRNRDGTIVTWEIQDFKIKSGKAIAFNPDFKDWTIQAIKDFDNDGDSDILWSNSRDVYITTVQEGHITGGSGLGPINRFGIEEQSNISYTAAPAYRSTFDRPVKYGGLADIDGDGRFDIWWNAPAVGQREAWRVAADQVGNKISYRGRLTRASSI